MVTIIVVVLAAVFNASMDLLENENFYISRFNKFPEKFWYKRESWKYARKIFFYKIDGWHIAKSVMICLLLIPAASNFLHWICLGIIWNCVFGFFYWFLKNPKHKK